MLKYLVALLLVITGLAGLYWYGRHVPPEPRAAKENIHLYYYDAKKDTDAAGNVLCSAQGLVPVERHLEKTIGNLEETIKLLLRGELTTAERAAGITTEFPLDGVELAVVTLENGSLTLTFDDPNNQTSGGACRAGVLHAQIEVTAKQFPGVREVKFMPEELFQP